MPIIADIALFFSHASIPRPPASTLFPYTTLFRSVRARGHDRRAGVVLATVDRHASVHEPDDVAHHTERRPLLREARPLLDVELEVRRQPRGVALRLRRLPGLADRPERVGDLHPVLVGALSGAVGQAPERRARTEEPDPESRAFFVAPPHHFDRPPEADAVVEQHLDGLDRAQHAERAVEPAALGNGVDVRPDEDRRRSVVAESPVQIRRGIAPHARAARPEPGADEVARALLLCAEAEARDARPPSADRR